MRDDALLSERRASPETPEHWQALVRTWGPRAPRHCRWEGTANPDNTDKLAFP